MGQTSRVSLHRNSVETRETGGGEEKGHEKEKGYEKKEETKGKDRIG